MSCLCQLTEKPSLEELFSAVKPFQIAALVIPCLLRENRGANEKPDISAYLVALPGNLPRTTVRAPFDAHIISREVNFGSQVAVGAPLGQLVGTDTYCVTVTVPVAKLRWITFPGEVDEGGAPVRISDRGAWPEGTYREGYVSSLVGALEGQTRLARVLVSVPDPLALDLEQKKPPLMIGAFVEARIQMDEMSDVARLNRDYLRNGGTVWGMADGKLQIREVQVVFQDAVYAYIREGLNASDKVVRTNISPMAISLVFATSIILLLVPCLYMVLEDIAALGQ